MPEQADIQSGGKADPHIKTTPTGDALPDIGRTQTVQPPNFDAQAEENLAERKLLKISCHQCLQKLDVTYLEPFSRFNCPSCGVELIVPTWFDNYLLEEPGGIGGMATVYRTLDLALDREVAIKILNPEIARQASSAELFLHEARTAATINHHAVIPIYTCGVFEGQPYIVMQYMAGGSLEAKLAQANGSLPIKDAIRWMRDVSDGLDNALRHGITHHDIKPGNIMLDLDGNAKIGDFGLAYAVNDRSSGKIAEMTRSWISPHYVSPERVLDGKEGSEGDVYSLGATFYHLATGRTPFKADDMKELLNLRLKTAPEPPHFIRPEISGDISQLISSMMERAPEKRPKYSEISKALSERLKTASAKTKPSIPEMSSDGELKTTLVAKLSRAGEPAASKKRLFAEALALLACVALGLGLLAWQNGLFAKVFGASSQQADNGGLDLTQDSDRLPEVTAAFMDGNVDEALKASEKAFSDVTAPMDVRMQAAMQLAIANYLAKSPKAKENCAFIAERIEAIRTAANPACELSVGVPPSKIVAQFLSDYEKSSAELRLTLSNAPESIRLAAAVAAFVRAAKTKAPKDLVLSELKRMKEESALAPKDAWSNAWQERIELWSKCVDAIPPDNPKLEPLIAGLPAQYKPQQKQKPAPPKKPQAQQQAGAQKAPVQAQAQTAAPAQKQEPQAAAGEKAPVAQQAQTLEKTAVPQKQDSQAVRPALETGAGGAK